MADFDLSGRVALVTGGSRGLGKEIVLGLAAAGADVVIASRKLDNCKAVAEEVETTTGRQALPVACHVGHWDQLEGLVDAAYDRFGKVDVLVNNAGMSPLYPDLMSVTEELYDKVFAVNLKGPFRLSVLVGTRMVQNGQNGNARRPDDIEDEIRESRYDRTPDVTVDDGTCFRKRASVSVSRMSWHIRDSTPERRAASATETRVPCTSRNMPRNRAIAAVPHSS